MKSTYLGCIKIAQVQNVTSGRIHREECAQLPTVRALPRNCKSTDRGWEWNPGAYGRGIERVLPPDLAEDLAAAHGSFEETVALFRRVAREVGEALGYAYPRYGDEVVSADVDELC